MSTRPGIPAGAAGRARLRPRPGSVAWWVFLLLLLVPLAEVAVIVSVGRAIGTWPTVLLLVVESLLGAWLVKREGARAWQALRTALATGRMPAGELADAALVLVGGTLLLAPGFLTDVVGFAAVVPVTRPVARTVLARVISRRLVTVVGPPGWATVQGAGSSGGPTGRGADAGHRPGGSSPDDDVIDGEIL